MHRVSHDPLWSSHAVTDAEFVPVPTHYSATKLFGRFANFYGKVNSHLGQGIWTTYECHPVEASECGTDSNTSAYVCIASGYVDWLKRFVGPDPRGRQPIERSSRYMTPEVKHPGYRATRSVLVVIFGTD